MPDHFPEYPEYQYPWFEPPEKKKWTRKRIGWWLFVGFMVLALIAAATGNDKNQPASTNVAATATTTTAPKTTTTTTAPATTTTAPATTTTTTEQPTTTTVDAKAAAAAAILGWYGDNGYLVQQIEDDTTAIGNAASSQNFEGVFSGCEDLAATVDDAQAADPIPAADVNDHWQAGLSAYADSMSYCLAAESDYQSGDLSSVVDDLRSSGSRLDDGSAEIKAAAEAIQSYQ